MTEVMPEELKGTSFFQSFTTLGELAGLTQKQIGVEWMKSLENQGEKMMSDLLVQAVERVVTKNISYHSSCDGLMLADVCAAMKDQIQLVNDARYRDLETELTVSFGATFRIPEVSNLAFTHPLIFTREARALRMNFWNDDKQSASSRFAIARTLLPGLPNDPSDPIYSTYNWSRQRDWLYEQSYQLSNSPASEIKKTERMGSEIVFTLDLDRKVAEFLASEKIKLNESQSGFILDNEVTSDELENIFTAHDRAISSSVEEVNRALERLFAIDSAPFNISDQRNPGLLLTVGLVLSEKTRDNLAKLGIVKMRFRMLAQKLHADKGATSDLPMKQLNFAYETMDDKKKFENWKLGNVSQQFPE